LENIANLSSSTIIREKLKIKLENDKGNSTLRLIEKNMKGRNIIGNENPVGSPRRKVAMYKVSSQKNIQNPK